MNDSFQKELVLSVALAALVVFLFVFNPTICSNPWMETTILFLIGLFVLLFIGLVWKERVRDERESLHRYIASRFAYIGGIFVLAAGIIYQTIQNHLDIWLVISLCTMLVLKMVGIIYGKIKY